ncbi:MAG: SDR family oxidoreductase [Bacteroidetes bacterium]|nr:SDR family oxidoreductase [Bacteroidota bacterium]MDA1121639.1 SDR family oxidoreductase [Bacteroidota bacterium]
MKYVLITGVSTGIGHELSKKFISQGYHVFGSVRKQHDFDRVKEELGEPFTPLLFDVTNHEAIAASLPIVQERIGEDGLSGLVNNAGLALSGPIQFLPMGVYRHQFEVNLFGAIAVTQTFLPLLGARKNCTHPPGRILNISSVAGKIAYPFMSPYSASKFALEGWSHSLRRELLIYGIDVIIIGPGPIKTPIWTKGDEIPQELLDSDYGEPLSRMRKQFQKVEEISIPVKEFSLKLFKVFEASNPKTRYTFLNSKFTRYTIPRLMPDRVLDKIIGRVLALKKGIV